MNVDWDFIKTLTVESVQTLTNSIIEMKVGDQYLQISVDSSCCGYAFIIVDSDLQQLVGKQVREIKSVDTSLNYEIKRTFKKINDDYLGVSNGIIHIIATDGTEVTFVMCSYHNGYYPAYMEIELSKVPSKMAPLDLSLKRWVRRCNDPEFKCIGWDTQDL